MEHQELKYRTDRSYREEVGDGSAHTTVTSPREFLGDGFVGGGDGLWVGLPDKIKATS